MVEGLRWPGEAAAQRLRHLFDGTSFGIEGAEQDALEAADIDEAVGKGACAGSVQALAAVAFAQRDELQPRAQFRPGQWSFEEPGREGLDVRTQRRGALDDPVGGTQGVGGLLLRIVLRI